jgi:hypothetical protein
MNELIEFVSEHEDVYRGLCKYKPTFDELATLSPLPVQIKPSFGLYMGLVYEDEKVVVYEHDEPDVMLSVLIHEITHALIHFNGEADDNYCGKRESEATAVEHLLGLALRLEWDITTDAIEEYDFKSYKYDIDYDKIVETADYLVTAINNLQVFQKVELEPVSI